MENQSTISFFIDEKKEEKPEICIDSREAASSNGKKIVHELNELGVKINVQRLDFGDYLIREDIAIERKTIFDLVGTLTHRFLFDQIFKMRESYPKSFVIIEGYMGILRKFSRISPESVNGALFALAQNGIPVVPTIDNKDTAIFLAVACKQLIKGAKTSLVIRHRTKVETTSEKQLFLVAGLPHVGSVMGDNLLRYFGTPRQLFNASKEELMAVRDVGPKTAEDIVETLVRTYNTESEEEKREVDNG